MRIFEIIADSWYSSNLLEMARNRADAVRIVESKQRQLNEHLVKYFYFDDQSKNHWVSEMLNFIGELDDIYLKPKNTRLSSKIYYDVLFDALFGHGTQVIKKWIQRMVTNEYKNTQMTGLTIDQVWYCIHQFYEWLCPLLGNDVYSDQLFINNQLVHDKLIKIMKNVK